jgi:hypothetical protein
MPGVGEGTVGGPIGRSHQGGAAVPGAGAAAEAEAAGTKEGCTFMS